MAPKARLKKDIDAKTSARAPRTGSGSGGGAGSRYAYFLRRSPEVQQGREEFETAHGQATDFSNYIAKGSTVYAPYVSLYDNYDNHSRLYTAKVVHIKEDENPEALLQYDGYPLNKVDLYHLSVLCPMAGATYTAQARAIRTKPAQPRSIFTDFVASKPHTSTGSTVATYMTQTDNAFYDPANCFSALSISDDDCENPADIDLLLDSHLRAADSFSISTDTTLD